MKVSGRGFYVKQKTVLDVSFHCQCALVIHFYQLFIDSGKVHASQPGECTVVIGNMKVRIVGLIRFQGIQHRGFLYVHMICISQKAYQGAVQTVNDPGPVLQGSDNG